MSEKIVNESWIIGVRKTGITNIESRMIPLPPRNTPIQEKAGRCMEARPKGPSAFATPGDKNKSVAENVLRWNK